MEYKTCNQCGRTLPIDDFYLVFFKARNKHYRLGHCKSCDNERHRNSYQKHRDKRLAYKKERFRKDPWNIRLRALYDRCKHGFLTVPDLKQLVKEACGKCSYCCKPLNGKWTFDHAEPVSKGGSNTPENIRVCCLSCNSQKGAMTEEEYRLKINGAPF